ncbi:hypothetical protein ALC57_02587, partial [Trachymyrmex cornetzi]
HSIQYDDVIHPFKELQLMCDKYPRLTVEIFGDALPIEVPSNTSIHRAQGIVEQIDIRLSINRPREIDSRSLATGQRYTSIADYCHISLWKLSEILQPIIIPGGGDLADDEEQQQYEYHEIVAAMMQIFLVYFARHSTVFWGHWTAALDTCPFSSHTLPGLLDSVLPKAECTRVRVLLPSSGLLPPRFVASPIESIQSLPLPVHTYSLQSLNVLAGLEINLTDPIKYPTDNHDRYQEDRIDHAGHYQRSEHQHVHLTSIQNRFRNRTVRAMHKLAPVWKNLINIGPLTRPRDVPSRPSFNFSGSSSSSSSSVPPLLASGHLLCYSKKKIVVVYLCSFLKMNHQSLHSLLPGVLHIRVDTLINPDNAKNTSFFPARAITSFTHNGLVTLWELFEVTYQSTSLDHLLVPLALVGLSEEYVLSDSSTENPGLLTGVADAAVDLHLTFRQTDLSENRGQEGALAATYHADHRVQLALFYFQIQILQSVLRLSLLPLGSNVDHIDGPLLKYVRFEIYFEYFYIISFIYICIKYKLYAFLKFFTSNKINSVLRHSHPNATDDELTNPIKVWLAHAKERLNRVKELQKEMNH